MHAIPVVFFIGICVIGVVYWERRRARLAKVILAQWAKDAGLQIITVKSPFLRLGPFWLFSRVQYIFQITVQDAAGMQRTGWARIGGFLVGLLSHDIKVIWDH